ncbi:MAG: phosphodiester glycosidase family protein [Deltaproteobacteria bacterium]|nr:phosphodiester glycosidase family protein [Deltaproteobacteria bacterium]
MRRLAIILGAILAVPAVAQADWQNLRPGVDYDSFTKNGTKVYALRIDSCGPGVRFRATGPGEGPRTTSSHGELVGAFAAINGDWWARDGFNPDLPQTTFPRGLAMGNGQHFAGTYDPPFYGFFAFGPGYRQHSIQEDEVGGPPWGAEDIVSGQPTLVWNGQLRDNPNAHCGAKRARTAVGMSADERTIYWAVVQEVNGSVGMTCNQMAALMKDLGAHSALNQDGGGSSTMWIRGQGVVNSPSDGGQRSLVTHWGLIADGEGPPRSCPELAVPKPDDGAVRRHVTSPAVMAAWGFDSGEVIEVPQDWLDAWPEGGAWPQAPDLIRAEGQPAVYIVDTGARRHVVDPYSFRYWRFQGGQIADVPAADVEVLPEATSFERRPFLVKGPGPAIYVLDHYDPASDGGEGGGGEGGGSGGEGGSGESPGPGPEAGEGGCAAGGSAACWWGLLLALGLLVARRKAH